MVRARCLVCSLRSTADLDDSVVVVSAPGIMPSPARFAAVSELISGRPWPSARASHKPRRATRAPPQSSAVQKGADLAPEGVEVHEKGVVPLDARERGK